MMYLDNIDLDDVYKVMNILTPLNSIFYATEVYLPKIEQNLKMK